MTLMVSRVSSPDEQARAAQRQAEDDRLNVASLAYRGQLAFACELFMAGDDFKAEGVDCRDAIRNALRKVERTLTLCGVQPIVQHYERHAKQQAETITRLEHVIRILEQP